MIQQYSLLFLVLAVSCQGQHNCDFETDLCEWSNVYKCNFKHVIDTPLAGETGYLILSKDTCTKAAIAFPNIQYFVHAFEMQYYINGPGRVSLTVIAEYLIGGQHCIWTCTAQQGPEWNHAEIFIRNSLFDKLKCIIIEAVIDGEATVAIGNIGPPVRSIGEHSCPGSPAIEQLNAGKTLTSSRPKIAKRFPVAEILRNTSIVGASKKTNDFNSTLTILNETEARNTTEFPGSSFNFSTRRSSPSASGKTATLNQDATQPKSEKYSNFYVFAVNGRLISKQINNEGPVDKQSTLTLNKTIDIELPRIFEDDSVKKRADTDSQLRWSVVTGCSLFAIMVLITLFVSSFIIYKRKIEILNVYEVDGRSLTNNLYY